MSAPEETFALLGPKPEVPPGWLEANGLALGLGLTAALGVAWLVLSQVRRRRARAVDPAADFRARLAAARQAAPGRRAPLAAEALRRYLAAISADAPEGLTTQELAAALVRSPLLATAADPIVRALRAADQAKFAGEAVGEAAALDLAELAHANLELARRALWREAAR